MNKLNKMYEVPSTQYLRVHHLHKGNSSNNQRHGHEFVTVAELESKNGIVIRAKSQCSKKDAPSRKLGRDIAVGRVLKTYHRLQAIK